MAQKTTTICDRCEKEKGRENHWFAVKVQNIKHQGEQGRPFTDLNCSLHIEPAQPDVPAGPERLDLCGEQCVIETVQEWLVNATTP